MLMEPKLIRVLYAKFTMPPLPPPPPPPPPKNPKSSPAPPEPPLAVKIPLLLKFLAHIKIDPPAAPPPPPGLPPPPPPHPLNCNSHTIIFLRALVQIFGLPVRI